MAGRRSILLYVALASAVAVTGFWWRNRSSSGEGGRASAVTIDKQAPAFATRSFDRANQPSDMPPLSPGDEAECDSNFLCNASLRGETRKTDATHAIVTIRQIKVTLNLSVTIWLPLNAPQNMIEHEDGHSQISQSYYQAADRLAQQIASEHVGDQVEIDGTDLNAEANRALQQAAAAIDTEFNRQLDPGPTQVYYDSLTDHGRNRVVVKDAVAAALRDNGAAPSPPAASAGN